MCMKLFGLKFYLFFTFSVIHLCLFSQENGAVWANIEDISILKQTKRKTEEAKYNSPQLQKIVTLYKITKIIPAFPNSKDPILKNVFEFQCNCNSAYLSQALGKFGEGISKPEEAPKFEFLTQPNDYNLAFANDYSLDLINAKEAWDITKGDSTVVIAISDANFKIENLELAGKVQYLEPNIANPNIAHGTQVAITAAGRTDNNYGKSSIGWNSGLTLYSTGYDQILKASNDGAKIINMSWASGCVFNSYCQSVIDEIYQNGTILVASAGNGNTCGTADQLVYPSAFNHVISVTSIGSDDNHEYLSSGILTSHQHNSTVDISAPGYAIPVIGPNGGAKYVYGTSFAAPLVSGTIALMLAVNPCLTFEQVEQILKETSTNIDAENPNYIGLIGAGRLNAGEALKRVNDMKKLSLTVSEQSYSCQTETRKVSLFAEGGFSPYTYSINNTTCNSTLDSISDGTYTIALIDSVGCIKDTVITIGDLNQKKVNYDYSGNISVNSPSFDLSDQNGDGIIKIKGNISISEGVNYEISDKHIEFGYNNGQFLGIKVEQDATLKIDKNSILKGLCSCPTIWDGIIVAPGYNGINSGSLSLDSTNIYDAKIAVNNEPSDTTIKNNLTYGKVSISNSVFTKNKVGINLSSSNNSLDTNLIVNSIFIFDDSTFIDPVHINISNVDNLHLLKNRFFGTLLLNYENKGTAVRSSNSNVYISEKLHEDVFSLSTEGNEFYNLLSGIITNNTDKHPHTIEILSNYFANVNHAIILDNYSTGLINHNEINVPAGKINSDNYGISLESTGSIVITDNVFTTSNQLPFNQFGILMNNCDTNEIQIYRNEFSGNFTVANLIQGNNLNTFINCNKYTGNNEHHWSIKSGKLNNQNGTDINGQYLIYKNEFNKCINNNLEIELDINSPGFVYQSKEVYMPINFDSKITKNIIIKNAGDNQCRNYFDTSPLIKTIDEEILKSVVSIFPNPTNEFSYVDWKETDIDEISIYSMSGKLEKTAVVSGENGLFEIKNLVSGIYLVKLSFNGSLFKTEKLVVER
jgi:hypothetical protein